MKSFTTLNSLPFTIVQYYMARDSKWGIGGATYQTELPDKTIAFILNEGFELRDTNDSYAERRQSNIHETCYKKYVSVNGFDVNIYICSDGIEIDQDYDCGGNMSTKFIRYTESFEKTWDKMMDYVISLKS